MISNHEIDYYIHGEEMQCVEIELDPQETVIAESGSFMFMDNGIEMQTIFGDGSQQNSGGFFDKLMGAGKRLLVGESLFMTAFTNNVYNKQKVAFAAPYAGKIVALDLSRLGNKIICQKDAFLCAAKGVSVGIEFQNLEQAYSVVKVLSWKSLKVMEWPLFMQVDLFWNAIWLQENN